MLNSATILYFDKDIYTDIVTIFVFRFLPSV